MKAIKNITQRPESPFLTKYACVRTEGSEMLGHYSKEFGMWVIESKQGLKPIIYQGVLNQLVTKTNVQVEGDDDTPYSLQLMTKTEQQLESDDESHFMTN